MSSPEGPAAAASTLGPASRAHVTARRVTLAAGLLCTLIAGMVGGLEGLVAGVIATLLVVAFFWSGMIPLFLTPQNATGMAAGLGILLLTYTLRLALALVVLRLSQRWGFADSWWIGVTIVACALTWIAVHVLSFVRRPRRRETRKPGRMETLQGLDGHR